MSDDKEDRLRRCTHHTMRVRGEPCAHWECVERNRAADRIDELEEVLRQWPEGAWGKYLAEKVLDG